MSIRPVSRIMRTPSKFIYWRWKYIA
jgi:hypothetical protein